MQKTISLVVLLALSSGCSALRYGAHLAEVPWGERITTKVIEESGPKERRLLVEISGRLLPAPTSDDVAVEPTLPEGPPAPAGPPLPPPPPVSEVMLDDTEVSFTCTEQQRFERNRTQTTFRAFGFVEKLVYGIVMLFEAATFTGIALTFSKNRNRDDVIAAGVVAGILAVDFVGWAMLVAFMPPHDHVTEGDGHPNWTSLSKSCPTDLVIRHHGRPLPLFRDGSKVVVDSESIVGELLTVNSLQVETGGFRETLSPDVTTLCRWASAEQRDSYCPRPQGLSIGSPKVVFKLPSIR